VGIIRRPGDRQDAADRLDPVDGAVLGDEIDPGLNRRSSSAWAKYADAFRRISFAWRSSRFSRSSAYALALFWCQTRLLVSNPAENPGHVRPAAPSGAVSRQSNRSSRPVHCEALKSWSLGETRRGSQVQQGPFPDLARVVVGFARQDGWRELRFGQLSM
jgi:hypothetical protein